jgi:hypothetical protein
MSALHNCAAEVEIRAALFQNRSAIAALAFRKMSGRTLL